MQRLRSSQAQDAPLTRETAMLVPVEEWRRRRVVELVR
jgi:hypothetical protein